MRAAVILAAIAVAGCVNTKDPVLVRDVCTRGHNEIRIISVPMTSCAKTCTTTVRVQPVPFYVCERYMHVVSPNPNFKPRRA